MIRLFAPLLLVALTLPMPAEGQVEFRANKTDEFTGFRRITTEFVQVEVQEEGDGSPLNNTASVSVICIREEGGKKPVFGLILGSLTDFWSFRNAETAYFLVDGERFKAQAGMVEPLSKEMSTGVIFEAVGVDFAPDLLSAISDASKVRMQVNGYEFDITEAVDNELKAVRRELRK